jgi:DNA-binding NtrC family response regulator
MKKRTLLIIEKGAVIQKAVENIFSDKELELISLADFSKGIELLQETSVIDAAILDYEFLKADIDEVIKSIKMLREDIFLLLVGKADTDELVHCVKLGVDDFIEKPVQNIPLFRKTLESHFNQINQARSASSQTDIDQISRYSHSLVGKSKKMCELKKMIYKVGPLDSTILVTGETGTGKEIVARMIHQASPKKYYNFVAVHCGGIPDTLLESNLFGHEKGSFTGAYRTHKGYFESADKGTIFLDEIGDTTSSFQIKLLRVLQEKEFRRIGGTELLTSNARVIAASNRDLKKLVKKGEFREDLYYRLNVISLHITPLRERREDIPLLIRYFVNIYSKKHNHLGVYLKPETIDILLRQKWTGNVRELENVIERLVALSDSDWISPSELNEEYLNSPKSDLLEDAPQLLPYAEAKNLFEKEYVKKLLARADGNISQAAKLAEMPRQNLHLKIKKHGLNAKNIRKRLKENSTSNVENE